MGSRRYRKDGKRVRIGFGQDPGQAGKSRAQHLVRALSGFTVDPASETGDKLTRFGPFSSQCRADNIKILRGAWAGIDLVVMGKIEEAFENAKQLLVPTPA